MKTPEEQTTEELESLGWNLYSQREAYELKVRSLNEAIQQLREELALREKAEAKLAEPKPAEEDVTKGQKEKD